MIRSYSFEQAAERLELDVAEFRFMAHHFWEFLPKSQGGHGTRYFSGADLALFDRIVQMQKNEQLDVSAIRQKLRHESAQHATSRRSAEMLAFCSGRPGAGTSTVVWNLAAALAQRGCRCTVVDGSLTPTAGESYPAESDSSAEWCQVLDSGVRYLNAAKVLATMEANGEDGSEELWRDLQLLDAASDFILIDTGAGCSDNALRYAMLVDETIMITTADVGVNADTFSVVRMLRDINPALPMSLIINRAASLAEAREAFARINAAGRKLSASDVPGLGWIIEDEAITRCIADGEAVVDAMPNSHAAKCMTLLAEMLANRLKPAERQNPGGLQELMKSLEVNLQRTAIFRGL